jgi:hypothetical protein
LQAGKRDRGGVDGAANVAFWHNREVRRAASEGPTTAALPLFGGECQFIAALQT